MRAWNPDAVRAGFWHAENGLSGLAPPGVHSAYEVALVASKWLSASENILKVESETSSWNCSSLHFSDEILAEVVNNFLADVSWAVKGQEGVLGVA